MFSKIKPSLRESTSWLVVILRIVDSGITALLIYPLLGLHDVRVALDTWYVLNRSFWLDMKIILKTVGCMIKGKGAY